MQCHHRRERVRCCSRSEESNTKITKNAEITKKIKWRVNVQVQASPVAKTFSGLSRTNSHFAFFALRPALTFTR
jgi:hypothetical protein